MKLMRTVPPLRRAVGDEAWRRLTRLRRIGRWCERLALIALVLAVPLCIYSRQWWHLRSLLHGLDPYTHISARDWTVDLIAWALVALAALGGFAADRIRRRLNGELKQFRQAGVPEDELL